MSRLVRGGTAKPVSRDQILRHVRRRGNNHFPCSADHEQDWQPYPVDPYSATCDDHKRKIVDMRWGNLFKAQAKTLTLGKVNPFSGRTMLVVERKHNNDVVRMAT